MNQIHPKPVVMGVGTAMGAVMLVTLFVGCQPGALPCDNPEWKEVCALENTGDGAGGTGGNTPPSTGMGGSSAAPPMTGGAKCSKWATVKEVEEKLILPSCGGKMGSICHLTTFEPKFKTVDDILPAMLDKTPITYCKNDKLVNKADPSKSVIISKIRPTGPNNTAVCPSGGGGGARMPFTPEPALSPEDADCLEWWVYQVAAAK